MTPMQARKCWVCLGVLVGVSATLAQQPAINVQAEVQKGIEALQEGKPNEAEIYFERALKADPHQPEVRANLGLAYYVDKKYEAAVDAFEQALKQKSSLTTAQAFLPLSLAALGRCQEASPGLQREFASQPDLKLRRVIGLSLQRCYVQTGQAPEADRITQQLVAQYPDDMDVLYEAGQWYGKQSSAMYLRLMKVAPHSARGYQVMGQVAASDGNWQQAVEAYRQAIQTDPMMPGVHLDLAVQLLLHSPDPDAWQEALRNLQAEIQISPSNPDPYYEIGEVYRKHDRPAEAEKAFRQALELRPTHVEARLGLAKVLREQNRKQEAVSVLEPATKMDPQNAGVHYLLAQLYRELGRLPQAQAEEAAFRRLQPSNTPPK